MQLPEQEDLPIAQLSSVFSDTTNSYKFYWFLSILDGMLETGQTHFLMQELSLRMMANVWYPLNYYKLSFGNQDDFKKIAGFISERTSISTKLNAPDLREQIKSQLTNKDLLDVFNRIENLLRWVPYRFIRPFFKTETKRLPDSEVNGKIVVLANATHKAPYRFDNKSIIINDSWIFYFQQHQYILRGFIHWHLIQFLQKNNPNVIAIPNKLERPTSRDFKQAKPFWKKYLSNHPDLKCIYSGQFITPETISLDHYIPFSFVAHDQLWNLIPTTKTVNSAKNDWIPDTSLYFDKYAQLQYDVFQFYAENKETKFLEDYSTLFRESTETINKQPFEWFKDHLRQAIEPQLQTARNMGFPYPFIY